MRTTRWPLLAALIAWLPTAWFATANADGFQSAESIRAAALAALPVDGAQATVDARLRMPACEQSLQAAANGPASVAVRCADNPGWQLYVPVRLPDGASAVQDGAAVTTGLRPLKGRRLQPASAFAPVQTQAPAVQRGDPVTLVSRAGGMEVRMAGRVLGAAPIGGTVSVENTGSRRIIRGRVAAPGVVEVNL